MEMTVDKVKALEERIERLEKKIVQLQATALLSIQMFEMAGEVFTDVQARLNALDNKGPLGGGEDLFVR